MRKYLSTLHTRPAHHKKRFAFLVSAGVTLSIFTVWSFVTFGTGGTLAQDNRQLTTNDRQNEVGPLESFTESMAASFEAIRESFEGMRDNVLNNYGQ